MKFGRGTRRQVIVGGGAAALVSACATVNSPAANERPNILWLVSEDNNPFLGAYGDRLAQTPTIDRLASNGLLYRNAYSTAPVCAPSRFTILTGVNAESCAPANHMRANAHLPDVLQGYPEYLRRAGYYCTNNAKTDYNCDVDPEAIWDANESDAHWRNRPAGAPFMAVFNFMATHESSLFGARDQGIDPALVAIPPYLPDLPEIREDYARYYGLMKVLDGQIAARLAELDADGLAEDTIVFYYSDNGGVLPRSKRYCNDEGLRCALVVHVPEKWRHLAPAPAGTEIAAPVSFVDLAPTVLSLAGLETPAEMQGRAFLGRSMRGPKAFAFGMRNRMDERYDMVRTVTDGRFRYIRNYMPHRPSGQVVGFAWIAQGYRAWYREYLAGTLTDVQSRFFEPRSYEELYDLATDPHQVTNLAYNQDQADRMDGLRSALDAHMIAVNDNGFIPEGGQHEGYLPSRVPDAYPLQQIMGLAALAAKGDRANLGVMRTALDHSSEAMRYWAINGLLIMGAAEADTRAAVLETMRSDPSIFVRIVAAEVLGRSGPADEAVAFLAGVIAQSQQGPAALYAINALTFIGSGAIDALPQVDQAGRAGDEYVQRAARFLASVLRGEDDPTGGLVNSRG